MSIKSLGDTAFRKWNTDGVPASGAHPPDKDDILAFVAALGSQETVVNALAVDVPALQTTVSTLESAQASGHVGFATYSAMVAAVGSYTSGQIADCYDPDPAKNGVYIHGGGASWGSRVDLLPTAAAANFETAYRELTPNSTAGQVVLLRTTQIDWIIRTPITGNGKPGEYTEWWIRDFTTVAGAGGRMLALYSITSNENGVIRVLSNGAIHGSVFEYAQFAGLMTDAPTAPNWNFYGNGHGNITYTGLSIAMDGGSNIRDMAIGSHVQGSSLVIAQSFDILLPKDGTTVIGSINQGHTFTSAGLNVAHVHTISAGGTGNVNSYSAMLPITGMNKAKFGSASAIDINLYDGSQSASQGQQSTIQAWHTDRTDLILEMILPGGNPGTPDGWTKDTTSDTFAINQTNGYTKLYVNSRSGSTAVAAAATASYSTNYRLRK